MAVAARKQAGDTRSTPATRVYVDPRVYASSAAPKLDPMYAPELPDAIKKAATKTRVAPRSVERVRAKTGASRAALFFKKLSVLVSVLCIAAAMIAVLTRYAMIATEYKAVNELRGDITSCELDIAALKVKLNSAVNIDAAREAALGANMDYPCAEQIIKVQSD